MMPGGTLTIRILPMPRTNNAIEIIDTGVGIQPADLDHHGAFFAEAGEGWAWGWICRRIGRASLDPYYQPRLRQGTQVLINLPPKLMIKNLFGNNQEPSRCHSRLLLGIFHLKPRSHLIVDDESELTAAPGDAGKQGYETMD
jgi:hypothetical protein